MTQNPNYYAYEHIMLNLEEVKKDFEVKMNQHYNDKTDNVYCCFDVNDKTTIWCAMPPKEFPIHLLSIRFVHKDQNELDWDNYLNRKKEVKKMLLKYEIPFRFDLRNDTYLGLYGTKNGFEYLIYKSSAKDMKPCIVRTYLERFENRKGEPIYKDIEIYQTSKFYCINEQITHLESLKYKEQHFNEWFTPRWISKQDLYSRWIPLFKLEGKILKYFSEEVRYSSTVHDEYDDIIRPLYKVRDTFLNKNPKDFTTAEEFFYVFEEKYPKIRKQLFIYKDELLGEKLEKFNYKDKIIVHNPRAVHEKLSNQKGEVVSVDNQYVKVKFLDYFVEKFYPTEITKSR